MQSVWTKHGWMNVYTDEEKQKHARQHEEAQKKYVLPKPPSRCKYCDDVIEDGYIVCEPCYEVEF